MSETPFAITLIIIEIIFSLMILKTIKKAGGNNRLLFTFVIIFVVWLFSAYTMVSSGFFSGTGIPQIAFTASVFFPVIVGLVAVKLSPAFSNVINRITVSEFLALQHMRVIFGIMFFFTSALPTWFQYLGGLGDIAAGVGAFLALRLLKKNSDKERQANIRGNIIGIIDFMIVMNAGVFVVLVTYSPDMIFDLIPLYVVPMFILLHIFSLQKLRYQQSPCSAVDAI